MVEIFNPNKVILEVTKDAVKHLNKHIKKENSCIGIYISIKIRGCSGLAYNIDFVVAIPENITEIEQYGLKFFVSNKDMNHLNGLKIDYVKHEFGLYKLEYSNPNESARCGCGESFTI